MQITLDKLKEWEACYYDEFRSDVMDADEMLLRWSGGRESMSALEVMDLDVVSVEDRLWVATRMQVLSRRDRRLFACDCAERVLPIYEEQHPGDSRPREAIEVARRFARGKATQKELRVAGAAACAAARAAWAADWAAARAAYAAEAVAYTTCAAAEAAAWAADAVAWAARVARAAARAVEREWQLERVKGYLGESCKSR
jgi:hypothetical protein